MQDTARENEVTGAVVIRAKCDSMFTEKESLVERRRRECRKLKRRRKRK